MTERDWLDRHTTHVYHAARRPRRPVVYQRALDPDESGVRGHSTSVITAPSTAITWAEARHRARALERVAAGLPMWPSKADQEKLVAIRKRANEGRIKLLRAPRLPRVRRGGDPWWSARFADAVERRENKAIPKSRTRGLRRKRWHAQAGT